MISIRPDIQTVSSIVERIKNSLETEFQAVMVGGEVSNLSRSSAGHWYLTISDSNSSLSAVLFKMDAMRNPSIKKVQDGDKVICYGGVGVYAKRGSFQLVVRTLKIDGVGDFKADYELMKRRLGQEGLFDQDRKRAIPPFPKKIAVISALEGAALQDFINVYKRRSFIMDLVVVPSLVQGENAPAQLKKAIEKANDYGKFDLIVLTRGGGSAEDLWAFNDERVVRAIAASHIPVMSAVGHQTDYSLSDLVADCRCETPTAAAEMITSEQEKLLSRMRAFRSSLKYSVELKLSKLQNRLARLDIRDRLYQLTPIAQMHQRLDESIALVQRRAEECLQRERYRIYNLFEKLNILDPQNVFARGYSYLKIENGTAIDSVDKFDDLDHDENIVVCFKDGSGIVRKV